MPLSDSSQTCTRAVPPELSPAVLWLGCRHRCLRGLPVLVLEVSRRVWGLRLRRTDQELALSPLFMLPSAHYKDVNSAIFKLQRPDGERRCAASNRHAIAY